MQVAESFAAGFLGDVSPEECWQALTSEADALLIDVRTQPEWVFSGMPNLQSINKNTQTISWKMYPTMELNPDFAKMVASVAPNPNTPLYFVCKTGGRSTDAAITMAEAGYTRCYNVADGFEGDRDGEGHRGNINGWKATKLPWEQA